MPLLEQPRDRAHPSSTTGDGTIRDVAAEARAVETIASSRPGTPLPRPTATIARAPVRQPRPRADVPRPDGDPPVPVPGDHREDRRAPVPEEIERLAEILEATGSHRVLRRFDLDRERLVGAPGAARATGVAVDVATAGADPASVALVGLSLRPFAVDGNGRVALIGLSRAWLEDPGVPLRHRDAKALGLRDADLRGRRVDDRAALDMLRAADVRVAFDARVVRAAVERRLPGVRGLPWACAMGDVDWFRRGYGDPDRPLAWLLAQARWYRDAPRPDADAVVAMLLHEDAGGCPAFAEMMAAAGRPGWRTAMLSVSFDRTADLEARGYRWIGTRRVWRRGAGGGGAGTAEPIADGTALGAGRTGRRGSGASS